MIDEEVVPDVVVEQVLGKPLSDYAQSRGGKWIMKNGWLTLEFPTEGFKLNKYVQYVSARNDPPG